MEPPALPIIFSKPYVPRVILGTKTQTRRPLKLPVKGVTLKAYEGIHGDRHRFTCLEQPHLAIKSPYGMAGDLLWVRETWGLLTPTGDAQNGPAKGLKAGPIIYKATDRILADNQGRWFLSRDAHTSGGLGTPSEFGLRGGKTPRWRPSIHMPKRIARIILRCEDVTPERLLDIDDEGAKRDGFPNIPAFLRAWKRMYGKTFPQESNPWVWRVSFSLEELREGISWTPDEAKEAPKGGR